MGSKKILVVDDQEQNVLSLRLRLEKVGYSVIEAYDGFEALEIVGKEYPDLILLDIMMPRINGFEVCKKITDDSRTSHIPIILVTAVPKREYVRKSFEVGAFDYVAKPFDFEELLHRISSALRFSENEQLINELKSVVQFLENLNKDNFIIRDYLKKSEEIIRYISKEISNPEAEAEIQNRLKQLGENLNLIERKLNDIAIESLPAILMQLKNSKGKETIN